MSRYSLKSLVLAAAVVVRYVPETKGMDNQLIGSFWRGRNAVPTGSA